MPFFLNTLWVVVSVFWKRILQWLNQKWHIYEIYTALPVPYRERECVCVCVCVHEWSSRLDNQTKKGGRKMRENIHIVDTETMDGAAGNRDRLQP